MSSNVLQSTVLGDLSKSLQILHQHLLNFQADQVGFTGSPMQLFNHATKDNSFAWLKPLRGAIVALDERRAEQEPVSEQEAKALGNRIGNMFEADDGSFRNRLNAAFQSDPAAVWAMAEIRKTLGALS